MTVGWSVGREGNCIPGVENLRGKRTGNNAVDKDKDIGMRCECEMLVGGLIIICS